MSSNLARQSTSIHHRTAPRRGAHITAVPHHGRREQRWHNNYEALLAFAAEAGHAQPIKRITRDGCSIGTWVDRQRAIYRSGRLPLHRQNLLEAVPGWTWTPDRSAEYQRIWDQAFSALQQFVDTYGHAQPEYKSTGGRIRLGVWVSKQREYHREGVLAPERARRLEALPGWEWEPVQARAAGSWEQAFERLRTFTSAHGEARPPGDHKSDDGFRLGSWVGCQRGDYRAGLLSAERTQRLEALPGWVWSGRETAADDSKQLWDTGFDELVAYAAEHGHASPGPDDAAYRWVVSQRRHYAVGRLAADQVTRLEGLPGWRWRLRSVRRSWDDQYAVLVRHVTEGGHARPPAKFRTADGTRLGQWTIDQRIAYRRGQLTGDQVRRLEQVPEWSWKTLTPPRPTC